MTSTDFTTIQIKIEYLKTLKSFKNTLFKTKILIRYYPKLMVITKATLTIF